MSLEVMTMEEIDEVSGGVGWFCTGVQAVWRWAVGNPARVVGGAAGAFRTYDHSGSYYDQAGNYIKNGTHNNPRFLQVVK